MPETTARHIPAGTHSGDDPDSTVNAAGFLHGEAQILASIAAGASLPATLTQLVRFIQDQFAGARCAVLVMDPGGTKLRVAAAPDLPATYRDYADGFALGPEASCCGTAAYVGHAVVVPDMTADARWSGPCSLAIDEGLIACWSIPIVAANGGILGIFAVFYDQPRQARPEELESLGVATHLAAVAIERLRQSENSARNEELYRGIFEHALDAIFLFDDSRRFTDANPAACALVGCTREDLIGAPTLQFITAVPTVDLPDPETRWDLFRRDGYRSGECVISRADGTERFAEVNARANFLPGLHLCVAHDITDKKLAEEGIRCAESLYRSLIETTSTGYAIADTSGGILEANAEYVRLSGHVDLDAIRGRHPREWTAPSDRGRLASGLASCWQRGSVRNLEIDFVDAAGHRMPVEINATVVGERHERRLLCLCRDITGRLQTQQELHAARVELENVVQNRTAELEAATVEIRSRARQQESVAELGRCALTGAPISDLMDQAVRTVAAVLDLQYCAVLEHSDPDKDELVMRAAFGWPAELIDKVVAPTDPGYSGGFALQSAAPICFEDITTETRFKPQSFFRDAGVVSGIAASIRGDHANYGVLTARCTHRRRFTADDLHFTQSVANALAAAIERHRAEDIIRAAQLGAVQANNAKIEFLSRMSHELRTPLNAILGFSQLLEIERLNAGQRESVEQITRAGRHLLELVNEVLDISRIDSGNMSLVPEPLNVGELWSEAVDLVRPLADLRSIGIHVEGDGMTDPRLGHHVLADRQRLRQVLLNLLSNAVTYNRPSGTVTVRSSVAPDARHVRLSVIDTGIGIAPENIPLLFKPFERLGAENTDVEGSGIGLALSKRLVEAQGGTLGVESIVGAGSTFWIDLPVAAAPLQDETAPFLFDELIKSQLFEDEETVDETPRAGAVPPLPAETRPVPATPVPVPTIKSSGYGNGRASKRIQRIVLHIEDNEPNQRLIEMLLSQRSSLKLLTASRGGEGLEMAKKYHPDLILLDVHLPDTSGEHVLHDLRADTGTRDTPVVIVSADAASIKHYQTHAIGANNYLLKPFNVTQFMRILDEYLLRDAA